MPRYADPTRCPDCLGTLPADPARCPSCALPLRGPDATVLFQTLQTADRVLGRLRASAPAVATAPAAAPLAAWTPETYPAPAPHPAPVRHGLSAASVPKILLGLGALCLLVAAVTFLAVAWTWLGVGGRTAVLVALTVVTGGLGTRLGRGDLRIAAESLTVVSLGLLVLDVLGADNADWLGNVHAPALAGIVGGVLLAASVALLLAPPRLVAPQLVAALGLGTGVAGVAGLGEHDRLVAAAGVVAFAALAQLGRLLAVRVLPWAASTGAAACWTALALSGLIEATAHPTLHGLWVDGHGWPLLGASALLLLPIAFCRSYPDARAAAGAAAVTLATVTLALPGLDDGVTRLTLVSLAVLVVWSAAALVTPVRWGLVPRAPLALATLPVLTVSVALVADAAARVLGLSDPFSTTAAVRLVSVTSVGHPGLLVPGLAALALAAAVLVPASHRAAARLPRSAAPAALLLAGAATLALTPVPLWTVVVTLAAAGAVLVADALTRPKLSGGSASQDRTATVLAAGGVALLVVATVAALPSAALTTGTVAVLLLAAVLTEVTGHFPEARLVSGVMLPAAAAGMLWSAAEVAGVDDAYRGAPVLLAVGILAILRPRLAMESSAALAAVVTTLPAIDAAVDQPTSLALHLTLAGALVSASALVTPSRRPAGWLGGLLLAAATWVRLADLGVQAPEAYTLPTAVALALLGLRRLHVDPEASTGLALVPGLALATTPSLLWVLADDLVSLRAVLLGTACLALVLGGATLRWSAPLVVGSAVGGLLVLAELAPYVVVTPQWVLIGAAGTVLTLVGVTWERRLRDLKLGAAYLGRLR
jgi:hypothetical protein